MEGKTDVLRMARHLHVPGVVMACRAFFLAAAKNRRPVLSGLKAGETVVVHPGDDLPEGMVVEPVQAAK